MLGGTADIRAYDLYLSAALLNGVDRGGPDPRDALQKSLEQIQRAIDRDDKFALAWVLKSKPDDSAQIYFPEDVYITATRARSPRGAPTSWNQPAAGAPRACVQGSGAPRLDGGRGGVRSGTRVGLE